MKLSKDKDVEPDGYIKNGDVKEKEKKEYKLNNSSRFIAKPEKVLSVLAGRTKKACLTG